MLKKKTAKNLNWSVFEAVYLRWFRRYWSSLRWNLRGGRSKTRPCDQIALGAVMDSMVLEWSTIVCHRLFRNLATSSEVSPPCANPDSDVPHGLSYLDCYIHCKRQRGHIRVLISGLPVAQSHAVVLFWCWVFVPCYFGIYPAIEMLVWLRQGTRVQVCFWARYWAHRASRPHPVMTIFSPSRFSICEKCNILPTCREAVRKRT